MFILGAQPNSPNQLSGFEIAATVTRGSARCRAEMNLATVLRQEETPATAAESEGPTRKRK